MSRIRQLVFSAAPDSRNSSADENACTPKPDCSSRSGNDSRTDSLSSTTDTRQRSLTQPSMPQRTPTVHDTLVLPHDFMPAVLYEGIDDTFV